MSINPQSSIFNRKLSLGLAALGRPGYITLGHGDDLNRDYSVAGMEAHAHRVLDEAWAGGVRYFDAARSYGRAEQFLGSWLRAHAISPSEVTVGSKWGYTYTADWQVALDEGEKHEVKEHTLPVLTCQIAESQANLGAYLNIYQIHSATLESGVLTNQPVLAKLAELRSDGLMIGLSVSGLDQGETIKKALEIAFDGQPLFGSVQATWNLLEQSAGPALAAAHDAGLVVIVKEVLANGRLTTRNNMPAFAAQLALLQQIADQLQTTIDGVAIAAALHQPWSSMVLSGAAKVAHLRSNLAAQQVVWSPELMDQLALLIETPQNYWQCRSQLAWN